MEILEPEAHVLWVRNLVRTLTGDVDTEGMELVRLVKMAANLFDSIFAPCSGSPEISTERWGLLVHLWVHEMRGSGEGLSPTFLSRAHRVSKNTISALLRGLEEQGLIARTLDAQDKRVFRIRLTDAGRELVRSMTPRHVAHLNAMVADLTPAERVQLAMLLGKLCRSLATRGQVSPLPFPPIPSTVKGG